MKLAKYWVALFLAMALAVAGGFPGAPAFAAVTKIAPTEAAPPHPFTIIDTPEGRLVDGSVAIFTLNGVETIIPLKTHKPYMTAQGNLPADMGGGDYQVSIRRPDGTTIPVGPFKVLAPVAEPTVPYITPTSGAPASQFIITDPQGRMAATDVAIFYLEGTDPSMGTLATGVIVSSDGNTLTGYVPGSARLQSQYFVSVRPGVGLPPRFNDIPFFVTG